MLSLPPLTSKKNSRSRIIVEIAAKISNSFSHLDRLSLFKFKAINYFPIVYILQTYLAYEMNILSNVGGPIRQPTNSSILFNKILPSQLFAKFYPTSLDNFILRGFACKECSWKSIFRMIFRDSVPTIYSKSE